MEIHEIEGLFIPGECYTMVRGKRRLYFKADHYNKRFGTWQLLEPCSTLGISMLYEAEIKTIEILRNEEELNKVKDLKRIY